MTPNGRYRTALGRGLCCLEGMDIDELRRIAAREELSLNYVAKDEMVSRALFGLQGNDDIVLKGGTAINRAYIGNKRFSEDIDLDLVTAADAKGAVPRAGQIARGLSGFEVERPRIMNGTIRYDLYYTNPLGHRDRIMLEFTVTKAARNYGKAVVGFGYVPHKAAMMNVYGLEELIRMKIACIMGRMEGKDFFDLYHLMGLAHKHIRIDREGIIKRISLEEGQIRRVANVINHYIPRNERPDWGMFLEELKDRVRAY